MFLTPWEKWSYSRHSQPTEIYLLLLFKNYFSFVKNTVISSLWNIINDFQNFSDLVFWSGIYDASFWIFFFPSMTSVFLTHWLSSHSYSALFFFLSCRDKCLYIVINFVANMYIQFISFSSLLKAVNFRILLIVPVIFYFLKNSFSLFSNCLLYSCPLLSFFLLFVLLFCFFSHIHPRKPHSLQGLNYKINKWWT